MYTEGPTCTSPTTDPPPPPPALTTGEVRAIRWAARHGHVVSTAASWSAWLKRPYPLLRAVALLICALTLGACTTGRCAVTCYTPVVIGGRVAIVEFQACRPGGDE